MEFQHYRRCTSRIPLCLQYQRLKLPLLCVRVCVSIILEWPIQFEALQHNQFLCLQTHIRHSWIHVVVSDFEIANVRHSIRHDTIRRCVVLCLSNLLSKMKWASNLLNGKQAICSLMSTTMPQFYATRPKRMNEWKHCTQLQNWIDVWGFISVLFSHTHTHMQCWIFRIEYNNANGNYATIDDTKQLKIAANKYKINKQTNENKNRPATGDTNSV